jgi:hypothetical protein
LNYAKIRPWWFRLLLLILFAFPLLGLGNLPTELHAESLFRSLGAWIAYAIFIWIIIGLAVGLDQLLSWLFVGVIFGLTVAVTGALLRHIHLWEFIEQLVAYVSNQAVSASSDEAVLVWRMIVTMIAVPYSLLMLESFPASDILHRVARPGRSKRKVLWLAAAIFLRVFQHVFEVAGNLFVAWKEENPRLLWPRHRDDWHGYGSGFKGVLKWIISAIWAWSVTLLEQAMLFVPTAVRDWIRIYNTQE